MAASTSSPPRRGRGTNVNSTDGWRTTSTCCCGLRCTHFAEVARADLAPVARFAVPRTERVGLAHKILRDPAPKREV